MTGEAWYDRFAPIPLETTLAGELQFVRLFEDGRPVAAVIAATDGPAGEPAAYLVRPGDDPRLVDTLERFDLLVATMDNALREVELGEWRALPGHWPRDLVRLGPAVLVLAGLR
ncbi:MAG TPA: hypothetical protein VGJ77_14285 [Gaiellaceae bacterium]|jgi:hypothetical protein